MINFIKREIAVAWIALVFLALIAFCCPGCGPTPAQVNTSKTADEWWTHGNMYDCLVTLHYDPPNGERETYENAVIDCTGGEYGTVWFKDSEGNRLCVHGSYKVELDPVKEE